MREDAKPYRAGPAKSGPQKKKAVNLTIDAELLAEAKAAGTNLSSVLETALKEQAKAAALAEVARGQPRRHRGQQRPARTRRTVVRAGLAALNETVRHLPSSGRA